MITPDALYVRRPADFQLPNALGKGRLCAVVGPRQVGKSSLLSRSMQTLQSKGRRCAFVDLGSLGHSETSEQDWFYGLLLEVAGQLSPETPQRGAELWAANEGLSPIHRWTRALCGPLLEGAEAPVTLFFDNLDPQHLPTTALDGLLSSIHSVYDARLRQPALRQLSVAIAGPTSPHRLAATGHPALPEGLVLSVADFTVMDARELKGSLSGLGFDPESLLDAIMAWTDGHPSLTIKLCRALREAPPGLAASAEEWVGEAVQRTCLDGGREGIPELAEARQRLLAPPHPQRRVQVLRQLLQGEPLVFQSGDEPQESLIEAGLVSQRRIGGQPMLVVRNRIIATLCDRPWLDGLTPGGVAVARFPDGEDVTDPSLGEVFDGTGISVLPATDTHAEQSGPSTSTPPPAPSAAFDGPGENQGSDLLPPPTPAPSDALDDLSVEGALDEITPAVVPDTPEVSALGSAAVTPPQPMASASPSADPLQSPVGSSSPAASPPPSPALGTAQPPPSRPSPATKAPAPARSEGRSWLGWAAAAIFAGAVGLVAYTLGKGQQGDEVQLTQLRTEVDEARAQAQQAKAEMNALRDQATASENQAQNAAEAAASLEQLKAQLAAARNARDALLEERNAAREKVKATEQALQAAQTAQGELTHTTEQIQSQLAEAQAQAKAAQRRAVAAQAAPQTGASPAQMSKLKAEADAARAASNKAQAQAKALNAQLQAAQSAQAKAQAEALKRESDLQRALETQKAEAARIQEKLAKAEAALEGQAPRTASRPKRTVRIIKTSNATASQSPPAPKPKAPVNNTVSDDVAPVDTAPEPTPSAIKVVEKAPEPEAPKEEDSAKKDTAKENSAKKDVAEQPPTAPEEAAPEKAPVAEAPKPAAPESESPKTETPQPEAKSAAPSADLSGDELDFESPY
ncbi:MAG: AAA-like domain-containing protein [Bradymonadia bacterium]